jgi:hypothetical protein
MGGDGWGGDGVALVRCVCLQVHRKGGAEEKKDENKEY